MLNRPNIVVVCRRNKRRSRIAVYNIDFQQKIMIGRADLSISVIDIFNTLKIGQICISLRFLLFPNIEV